MSDDDVKVEANIIELEILEVMFVRVIVDLTNGEA